MKLGILGSAPHYFQTLARLAALLVTGSEALLDFLEHFENPGVKAARLQDLEHQADGITHEVMTHLH